MMRLAIVGSRDFADRTLLDETLAEYLGTVDLVVSGGAAGADRMGEDWARRHGIATRIFLPEMTKHRHPFHARNREIVEACDSLIAFWNGRSSGTRYTIDYARRMGKKVRIVRF
jgi:predicted Rossmann fold nucleotide-binding protein DprA/Smf involved in DNA uptake